MPMDERAVRGVPWTLLSYGVNRAVLVLTTVGLARILHPDDYGLVALATVCQLLGVRSTLRSIAGRGPGAESSVAKLLGVRNRQEASELVVRMLGPAALLASDDQVAADVHEMLLTRCLSIAGGTTLTPPFIVAGT